MEKTGVLIVIFLTMAGAAAAQSMSWTVRDYNTVQPVENVNVSASNDTYYESALTDVYGNVLLAPGNGTWTVYLWRSGYASSSLNRTLNGSDTDEIAYLSPQSTSGIIRLRFSDLTLASEREFCVYFQENMRLQGCYALNDTVTLHTNLNYTLIPKLVKADLIGSPKAVGNYFYLIAYYVMGPAVTLVVVGGFAYVIWRLIRRREK